MAYFQSGYSCSGSKREAINMHLSNLPHSRALQTLAPTMRKHIIFGLAALVAAAVPVPVRADADAFPWKLLQGTPNGTWYVAHEYATERACRSDGEIAAREATASNCSAMACAVPVWCVNKRAAEISAFPGTGSPPKLRCHPAYYGVAPGATKPAQHPEWCEYVK
jgi:hypothetical protein